MNQVHGSEVDLTVTQGWMPLADDTLAGVPRTA